MKKNRYDELVDIATSSMLKCVRYSKELYLARQELKAANKKIAHLEKKISRMKRG